MLSFVDASSSDLQRALARKLADEVRCGRAGAGEEGVLADQLAAALAVRRAHVVSSGDNGQHVFDPRFLNFEFGTGFVLRPPQVALVTKLAAGARAGTSVCHQMLMGEGKTTVISPLLALPDLPADG